MSGFEVAGVVLGVLPLVINALSKYREEKGTIATLMKFGGLLDHLIHQLKEQKRYFYLDVLHLLREARVPEILDDTDPPEERCVAVLRDARTSKEVMTYLGRLYEDFLETLGYYETCLKDITSKLSNIARLENASCAYFKTAKDDLSAILLANSEHRQSSVRGRLKFTIDRKSLEALVEDLRSERYSIGKLLKYAKKEREWEAKQSSHESERMVRFFDQIHQSATSLHTAACRDWACDQHERHTIMIRLEHRLSKYSRAGHKAPVIFRLCFPYGETLFQEIVVRANPNQLDGFVKRGHPCSLQQGTKTGLPTISVTTADSKEPKSPGGVCVTNMCDNVYEALQRRRILALRLTGQALNLTEDAIVAQKSYENIQTLADLLTSATQRDESRMMPLEQGLLALNIATAALQLRHTSWCESPWDKKTIKFLVESNGMMALSAPYVENAVGPERPASQSQQSSLQAMKGTLLELAILMLEILQQKSFDTWAFENLSETPVNFWDRLEIATRWVEQSTNKLLPNHLKAVEECLAQCVRGRLEWDVEFQKLYCENVVQPLQQLVMA